MSVPPDRDPPTIERVLGAGLFLLGLLLTALTAFVSAWPDMESNVFDASTTLVADHRLGGLRCPVLVLADETAAVKADFSNATPRDQTFLVRARISQGFVSLWRQDSRTVRVPAGQTVSLSWPVAARDAAYGRMILARVLAMGSADLPPRQASCGALVLDLPGPSGNLLFVGAVLWIARRPLVGRRRRVARSIGAVAAILLLSLASGLLGWWLASHLLLILAFLVPIATLERLGAS